MMCKYYSQCEQASSTAFTCTQDEGGTYCGKFRTMADESEDGVQISLLCRPILHLREMLSAI